jgi:hypothetical protein
MLTKGSQAVQTPAGRGFSGKLADPQARIDRARKGGRSRTTLAYHIDAIAERRDELTMDLLAEVAGILAQALSAGGDLDAA